MKRGFTLIELLVVVAIIGMLSSVVLSSLNTARGAARDSRRIQDLKQLQTAFTLYANDNNGSFPAEGASANGVIQPGGALESFLVPDYMPALPSDPINNSTYAYYYDGYHNCTNSPDHPVAIIFAREMDSSSNSNYSDIVAECTGVGSQGRNSGTNSYNIILGAGTN